MNVRKWFEWANETGRGKIHIEMLSGYIHRELSKKCL